MTLEAPSFGVYENSKTPQNGYEKSNKPYIAYENVEICVGTGSGVLKTESELVDIRQSDGSAYANLAFYCESGRHSFPNENQIYS
jgi:hypothetical protein